MLDYAVAITVTPVDVSEALFAALRTHLSDAQLVELTAVIAQENFRARFNRPLRGPAPGFSAGGYCPLPERGARDVVAARQRHVEAGASAAPPRGALSATLRAW